MKSRGATLVELMVAVAILGIGAFSFVQILISGNASSAYLSDMSDMVENGDAGYLDFPKLNGLVHQTRTASSVVKIDAATLTVQVSDTSYKFYRSGTDLVQENLISGAKKTIARYVKSVAFKYYGLDATSKFVQTTDTTLVKTVSMDLQIESDDKKRVLNLSTAVTMRNKS